MSEKKEYPTMKKMLSQGQIMVVYGSKYLVSVNPAMEIEKVRFSVVKLETMGKDSFDFYLDAEQMRQFCEDIDCGTAAKKIAQDTGNYPSAYQWVGGAEGSKRLVIGGGEKGIRVQTTGKRPDGSGPDRRMTIIQYEDLRQMSFLYKLITGITLVSQGSYYDVLKKTYWDALKERRKDGSQDVPDPKETESVRVTESSEETSRKQPFNNTVNKNVQGEKKVVPIKIITDIRRDESGIIRCIAVTGQKRFSLCFKGNELTPEVRMNEVFQAEVLTKKDSDGQMRTYFVKEVA